MNISICFRLAEKCSGVAEGQRHMALLRETLLGVVSSKSLGKNADDDGDDDEKEKSSSGYPKVMGFEQLITQRLLPPTFPRYSR